MDEGNQAIYLGSNEEVAQRLGITPAGLRRLADIYSEIYEPLQRDIHYNNRRLWTLVAVERLEAARALVQADKARSIKSAFQMLQGGVETPLETLAVSSKGVSKEPILLAVLAHMQRLESKIEMMQKQLEAPKRIAVIDNSKADKLSRMNAYLLDELERRRLEEEVKRMKRQWWKW